MDLMTTLPGSMMEGFFPAGWDLAKIDRLADLPPDGARRAPSLVAPAVRAGRLRLVRGLRHLHGPRDRPRDPAGPAGGPAHRLHPARRADGHVPLGGLLPQGVGRALRPRPRLQHGRVVRRRRATPCRPSCPAASSTRWSRRSTARSASCTVPPKQRHFALKDELPTYADQIADLKKQGAKLVTVFGIGRVCHIAFWEPHFAAEFAERGRVEGADAPPRRPAAPADDRAERHHQLPQPDDAGAGLRQHHRAGAVPGGRPHHRRGRRRRSAAACSGRGCRCA